MPEQEVTIKVEGLPYGYKAVAWEKVKKGRQYLGTYNKPWKCANDSDEVWSLRVEPIPVPLRYRPYTPEEAVRLLGETICNGNKTSFTVYAIGKCAVFASGRGSIYYEELVGWTHNGSPCGVEVKEMEK